MVMSYVQIGSLLNTATLEMLVQSKVKSPVFKGSIWD